MDEATKISLSVYHQQAAFIEDQITIIMYSPFFQQERREGFSVSFPTYPRSTPAKKKKVTQRESEI